MDRESRILFSMPSRLALFSIYAHFHTNTRFSFFVHILWCHSSFVLHLIFSTHCVWISFSRILYFFHSFLCLCVGYLC